MRGMSRRAKYEGSIKVAWSGVPAMRISGRLAFAGVALLGIPYSLDIFVKWSMIILVSIRMLDEAYDNS